MLCMAMGVLQQVGIPLCAECICSYRGCWCFREVSEVKSVEEWFESLKWRDIN